MKTGKPQNSETINYKKTYIIILDYSWSHGRKHTSQLEEMEIRCLGWNEGKTKRET